MRRLVVLSLSAVTVLLFAAESAGAQQAPGSTTPTISVSPTSVVFPGTATAGATFTVDTAYPAGTDVEVGVDLFGTAGTGTLSGFTPSAGLTGCVLASSQRAVTCTIVDPTQAVQHTLQATIAVGDASGQTLPFDYDVESFVRVGFATAARVETPLTILGPPPTTTTTTTVDPTTTTTSLVPTTTSIDPATTTTTPAAAGNGGATAPPSGTAAAGNESELAVTGAETPWIALLALGLLFAGGGGLLLVTRES